MADPSARGAGEASVSRCHVLILILLLLASLPAEPLLFIVLLLTFPCASMTFRVPATTIPGMCFEQTRGNVELFEDSFSKLFVTFSLVTRLSLPGG